MGRKEQYFTISELSTMLNLSGPTLRFWENKFAGIFMPLRTNGGQRRYTDAHIDILKTIIKLKNKGLKLTEIRAEMISGNRGVHKDILNDHIDILTERIKKAVRKEIHQFLNSSLKSN